MPRGGMRVKPPKATKVDAATASSAASVSSAPTKLNRTNTDWKTGIPTPAFLSRKFSESKVAELMPEQPPMVLYQERAEDPKTIQLDPSVKSVRIEIESKCDERSAAAPSGLPEDSAQFVPRAPSQNLPDRTGDGEEPCVTGLDALEDLDIDESQSDASSLYSRDSSSIYSTDSASIYSSASSVYSSGASIYSIEECELKAIDRYARNGSMDLSVKETELTINSRVPGGPAFPQRTRSVAVRRQEIQDAASRERSTLARKAAMFKNSRLRPQLPSFNASLPTWSMVCRAAHASQDCYDSQAQTRRGTYTPADSSKDIKAMIVDDQLIDNSRLLIVSVRGSQFQSLADWTVNKAANPEKPAGFLDDEENACHAGFLQVTKAMVGQVATQLKQHPASSEMPSLLFTGHSAGGAVAAIMYSHMLSSSTQSDLTAMASQFSSINCVTFGAPPISLKPLPRREQGSGIFLSFANEGDPILRLSNAAYVKSLAKLMTATPPASATIGKPAVPLKVVRRSRGNAVIRQTLSNAPATPWEELPMWPTPPAPLTNAGDVILLRDKDNFGATASRVTEEDLDDVIFGDLAQHTIEMYLRRVKEVALNAMIGRCLD